MPQIILRHFYYNDAGGVMLPGVFKIEDHSTLLNRKSLEADASFCFNVLLMQKLPVGI